MTCTIISTGEELDLVCKNENEPPYPGIKQKLFDKIWELYCIGYDSFWVNCEYGVPLWCAEIITALSLHNDIKLQIAMPYEEQSTNWVEEFRDRFFAVHSLADSVELIAAQYDDECYDRADKYMIDASDMLLIVGSRPERPYISDCANESGIQIQRLRLL